MYYMARFKGEEEEGQCNGCRICILSCPEANAIMLVNLDERVKKIKIYEPACKGCGLCVEMCPKDILEVASG